MLLVLYNGFSYYLSLFVIYKLNDFREHKLMGFLAPDVFGDMQQPHAHLFPDLPI
jgi:hypothetical protein